MSDDAAKVERLTLDEKALEAAVTAHHDARTPEPAKPATTFEEAFAATGYQYGEDALEQVRFGWELAHGYRTPEPAQGAVVVDEALAKRLFNELGNRVNSVVQVHEAMLAVGLDKIAPMSAADIANATSAILSSQRDKLNEQAEALEAANKRHDYECASLRADVNWKTGHVVIRRGQVDARIGPPKNGTARDAAFPAAALEVLRGHVAEMDRLRWPGHDEWLFPCRPNVQRRRPLPLWNLDRVGKVMREVMRAQGIHTVNATHVCRHTLIGLMRGEAAAAVMRSVVGHADEKTNSKYGAAKVIAFAKKVERVVMRPAKAGKQKERLK